MKSYTVRAVTTYQYGQPVGRSHHAVRLLPRSSFDQTIRSATMDVLPVPKSAKQQFDFFGNAVNVFTLEESHETLSLSVQAEVSVARQPSLLMSKLAVANVATETQNVQTLSPDSPAHFVAMTTHTLATPEMHELARNLLSERTPILDAAAQTSRHLFEHITYDPKATEVSTTSIEAFRLGAGVCQDFAHIMIALCRCAGVPARYVSGYIRTVPPPGQKRLEGADAMHAWVSVWTGRQSGWVDFDPTNGIVVSDDHIAVAYGRDYFETAPVRGDVVGGGEQQHTVAVDVEELNERKRAQSSWTT